MKETKNYNFMSMRILFRTLTLQRSFSTATLKPNAAAIFSSRKESTLSFPNVPRGTVFLPIDTFHSDYSGLLPGCKAEDCSSNPVSLVGRIYSIRASSKNLLFFDIIRDNQMLQIVVSRNGFETEAAFATLKESLCMGDLVAWTGIPGRTKTGELSLYAKSFNLLTPAQRDIPFRPSIKAPVTISYHILWKNIYHFN